MFDLIPYKYLIDCSELDEVYYIECITFSKWIITNRNSVLGRDLSWVSRTLLISSDFIDNVNNYIFTTAEKASELFSTYVEHRMILNRQLELHKKELESIKQEFNTDPIYALGDAYLDLDVCISPIEIEDILKRYSTRTSAINKSSNPFGGVQLSVTYLSDLLFLEDTLKKIQKDNNYKIINYFNFTESSLSRTAPLCYYWKVYDSYTRHFTFIKE